MMKPTRACTAIAGLAVAAVATLGLTGTSLAQSDVPPADPPAVGVEGPELDDCGFVEFEDYEPTAEELEAMNAETDGLVAHLAANGVTVEVETDELGFTWPILDNLDDAGWQLVDDYYTDLYGDEFDELDECEGFDDFELTDEIIAEINAETDGLVAHLAANGITVEVETDDDGLRWPVLDDIDDEATWQLVDQYYQDTYGDAPEGEFCEEDTEELVAA